jgi:hypothetical protein
VLHRAVREGWPEVLARAAERGGLPKRVKEEVRRYLGCGVLEFGFVHVRCAACRESMLVGFSCKGRGFCPSCGTRRSEETAAHCGEVLPTVGYRQWTLSLPRGLRWPAVKTPRLLKRVERRLVQGIFRWQRRAARRLAARGVLRCGAVAFTQYFGGALQLTPHLHLLVPEGLWAGAAFVPLPPPAPLEVEGILRRVVKLLAKDFEGLEVGWPEDELEALQSAGIQHRLPLADPEQPSRSHRKARLAVLEGFRLHADTHVHANDRQGLERLCRYGSRGPIAEERLSVREDGRYEYRTKRGPVLVLTAAQLVKRLVALVPPRGKHLTTFHGVFAPNAGPRPDPAPCPSAARPCPTDPSLAQETPSSAPAAPTRPRLDWATLQARTFGVDVWTCPCGGRRKVLAIVTCRHTAEEVLGNMGLLERRPPRPVAQGPPQLALAL